MYNHIDPPSKQIPLPVEQRTLPRNPTIPVALFKHTVAIPTIAPSHRPIIIELATDSLHMRTFFAANWCIADRGARPDASILALRSHPGHYGLPDSLDGKRWYCPHSHQLWMFNNEYYGNLKITVRGLCSDLSAPAGMFLHGSCLEIDGKGVVLSGMSGVGKTAITAALRRTLAGKLRVVNDDWGPLSLDTGELRSTDEPYLHMKYQIGRAHV